MSIVSLTCANVSSSTRLPKHLAALLIKMWIGPCSLVILRQKLSTSAASARLILQKCMFLKLLFRDAFFTSAMRSFSRSSLMSQMIRLTAPDSEVAANFSANCLPRPQAPPVIKTFVGFSFVNRFFGRRQKQVYSTKASANSANATRSQTQQHQPLQIFNIILLL